jgi:hypothetical protein
MDIHIPLTDEDRTRVAQFVSHIVASKPNRRRSLLSTEERIEAEIAGKLAEVAVGRHFGWLVDFAIHAGGDGHADFTLRDGSRVDVKAVSVRRNLAYDFNLVVSDVVAEYFVQVLVPHTHDYALLTGGISRARFVAHARPESAWSARGPVVPWVVPRSALRHAYPPVFWLTSTP